MSNGHNTIHEKKTSELYVDLIEKVAGLVASELKLAQFKVASKLGFQMNQILLIAGICILTFIGIEAITLCFIVLVGKAMDDRFWLSSIMIGSVYLAIIVPIIFWYLKRTKDEN